jgi:hypothetical protein
MVIFPENEAAGLFAGLATIINSAPFYAIRAVFSIKKGRLNALSAFQTAFGKKARRVLKKQA